MEEDNKMEQIAQSIEGMVSISERLLDIAFSIPVDSSTSLYRTSSEPVSVAKEKASRLEAIGAEKGSLLAAIKTLYEITQSNEVGFYNSLTFSIDFQSLSCFETKQNIFLSLSFT